ncbi:hypothetical protein [Paenibacillus mendelii]|uniref:Copper amine oxidase-like N-terminal domain-containing protein n=1 Tax=Paenibacillus mendelii TaxID=206163 RepID=A0ABV6JJR9_9BACL|nr:hypothetical protein [Paenibacillus mendelii]MCQ6559099.1 copper amine oxidase N-terminal domain-containing protein [Paenibacillus mendelii]
MLKRKQRIWQGLAAAVVISLAGGAMNVPSAEAVMPVQKKIIMPSQIVLNGEQWQLNDRLQQVKGRFYLTLKDASMLFPDAIFTSSSTSPNVTMLHPDLRVVFIPGSSRANVNGKAVNLGGVALTGTKNSPVLAIADLAKLLKGTVAYNAKTRMIHGAYTPRYSTGGSPGAWAWCSRETHRLYTSRGTEKPGLAGTVQGKFDENSFISISAAPLDPQSIVVSVTHSHGEPHLASDLHKVLIHQGKIVKETEVNYYGFHSTASIEKADGHVIMLDNDNVHWVRPDGVEAKALDLKKKFALDEPFTVEYADQDVILFRPYNQQTLMLYTFDEGAAVVLYKELLSQEEQGILESWGQTDADFPGDKLIFQKREGNTFYFKHKELLGHKESFLTFSLD